MRDVPTGFTFGEAPHGLEQSREVSSRCKLHHDEQRRCRREAADELNHERILIEMHDVPLSQNCARTEDIKKEATELAGWLS
jgi:hypothetical protein